MHKHINYQLYFRASTGNQKLLNINKHTNRDEQEKVGERERERKMKPGNDAKERMSRRTKKKFLRHIF